MSDLLKRIRKKIARTLSAWTTSPMTVNDWRKVDDFDLITMAVNAGYFREWLLPAQPSELPSKSVMVLAPHQDDEVIGCGGLLLKLRAGFPHIKITIVYVTDGNQPEMKGGQVDSIKIRNTEAESVCHRLGATPVFMAIPNYNMNITKEASDKLAAVIKEAQPEIILSPWVFDTPYKHRLTNLLLAVSLKNRKVESDIWGYQVHNLPFPNIYIPIDEEIEEKVELMKMYKSQLEYVAPYDHYIRGINIWGAKASLNTKIKYAELYFVQSSGEFLKLFSELVFEQLESYLKNQDRPAYFQAMT